jgi:hypothetical protein
VGNFQANRCWEGDVGKSGQDRRLRHQAQKRVFLARTAQVATISQQVSVKLAPRSLRELCNFQDAELAQVDIARMNLLCADGLPGSESLDIDAILTSLADWAKRVRFDTDRHLYKFRRNPGEYENSEAYYRMAMLVTVLQQDLGVRYNLERMRDIDFTNSKDLFIHGMVNDNNGGTCVSMPVLYASVGRRLGYPLKLTTTHAHVFLRWEGLQHANPAWRERRNIEGSSSGMHSFPDSTTRACSA